MDIHSHSHSLWRKLQGSSFLQAQIFARAFRFQWDLPLDMSERKQLKRIFSIIYTPGAASFVLQLTDTKDHVVC